MKVLLFIFIIANASNTPADRVLMLWLCGGAHRLSAGVVLGVSHLFSNTSLTTSNRDMGQ